MEGFADYESQLWNLIADARLLLTPDYCWRPRLRDPKAWSDQKAEKIFLQVGFVCWHVQVVVKLDFSFKAFFPFTSRVVSMWCSMIRKLRKNISASWVCLLICSVQVAVKLDFSCKAFAVDISSWFNIVVLKLHILFSRIITANFKGFLHFFTELYTAYALQEFWNCVFAIATSSL